LQFHEKVSAHKDLHLQNIENRILSAITALPYDVETARVYGEIEALLAKEKQPLPDVDLQVAATAIVHGLELVTGNVKHFSRIKTLRIHNALFRARSKLKE
jgi:tRNA(fMet)-specific endonuclease VapC